MFNCYTYSVTLYTVLFMVYYAHIDSTPAAIPDLG